jgi:hypothetical protein
VIDLIPDRSACAPGAQRCGKAWPSSLQIGPADCERDQGSAGLSLQFVKGKIMPSTDTLVARQEQRLRRQLRSRGYRLKKSRRAPDCYSIVNVQLNALMFHYRNVSLDQIKAFLPA